MTYTVVSTVLFVLAAFALGSAFGRARERERIRERMEYLAKRYHRG